MSEAEINIAFAELLGWTDCKIENGIGIGTPPKHVSTACLPMILEEYSTSWDKVIKIQDQFILSETDKLNYTNAAVEGCIKNKIGTEGNYYYRILTMSLKDRCECLLLALGKHKTSIK